LSVRLARELFINIYRFHEHGVLQLTIYLPFVPTYPRRDWSVYLYLFFFAGFVLFS